MTEEDPIRYRTYGGLYINVARWRVSTAIISSSSSFSREHNILRNGDCPHPDNQTRSDDNGHLYAALAVILSVNDALGILFYSCDRRRSARACLKSFPAEVAFPNCSRGPPRLSYRLI